MAPDTSRKVSLFFDSETDPDRFRFYRDLPLGTQMGGARLYGRKYSAQSERHPGSPTLPALTLEVVFEYPDKRFEPV